MTYFSAAGAASDNDKQNSSADAASMPNATQPQYQQEDEKDINGEQNDIYSDSYEEQFDVVDGDLVQTNINNNYSNNVNI